MAWGERGAGVGLHESACCGERSSRAGGAGSLCFAGGALDADQGSESAFSHALGRPACRSGGWALRLAVGRRSVASIPTARRPKEADLNCQAGGAGVPKWRLRRPVMRLSAALRRALLASHACCCSAGPAWALAAATCKPRCA